MGRTIVGKNDKPYEHTTLVMEHIIFYHNQLVWKL